MSAGAERHPPEGTPHDAGRARRRVLLLLVGLAALLVWQYVFFSHGDPDTSLWTGYRLEASNGVAEWQPEFVYFLYYLNLYPVVSLAQGPRDYSVEGARRLISEQGSSLATDRYWTIRYGDLGKTYLYLPNAWLKGRAARPRMLPANAAGFTAALLALFAAFWYVRKTALGAILVLLLGSNPFQVSEVYANNNLFGWSITIMVLLLALHVPLIHQEGGHRGRILLLALVSGVLLGTIRQLRTEPTLVILGVAAVYLTATHIRLWLRLASVLVLGGTFVAVSSGWTAYFDAKFREAQRVVQAAGGHVYNGPRHSYHFFWHALWCGLGDFDLMYGHRWSDITAYSYAWSIRQQHRLPDPSGYPPRAADPRDAFSLAVYWDEGRQYPRTPYETPEYVELIRAKLIRDIVHDPMWYAGILVRRAGRLLAESTPPSLAIGNGWWVSLPGRAIWGYLGLAAALWLLRRRDWPSLKLTLFTLPLAGTALFVYSGGGTPMYSIAHLVALAVVAPATAPAALRLLARVTLGERSVQPMRPLAGAAWQSISARARMSWARRRTLAAAAGGWALLIVGVMATGMLVLTAVAAVARARSSGANAVPAGSVQIALLRFDNQTSDEELAWLGDAVPHAIEDMLGGSGVRVLGPEGVDNLDADLVWWGPYGVLSTARDVAVNVTADRSGAARVISGRIAPGHDGFLACSTLWSADTRRALLPEQCQPIHGQGVLEASRRLVEALLPELGLAMRARASGDGRHSESGDSVRLVGEARRAIRMLHWGKADELLRDVADDEAQRLLAMTLRARMRSRWDPLREETLRTLTGAADPRGAVAALQARLVESQDDAEVRLDLARILIALELFAEGQRVLEPLRWRAGAPPEVFGLLAESMAATGELDRGYLALREYLRRSWREPRAGSLLAQHLLRWDDLERASLELQNAGQDRRRRYWAEDTIEDLITRWRIHALHAEWKETERLARAMVTVDDPRANGVSALLLALSSLFEGRSRLAVALAEESAFLLARQRLDPAPALRLAIEVRIEQGDAGGAVGAGGTEARSSGDPRLVGLRALALARAGRALEAQSTRNQLAESIPRWPGPVARRALHQLDGELALDRKDASGAVAAFSQAETLLPARGFCGDHVPIWFGLARAYRAANDAARAETWFRRVAEASFERLCWPIPYARSLAELGRIQAEAGRTAEATSSFEHFLALWGDADFADQERRSARAFLERQAAPVP